jgi:hypothetical protein
LDEEVSANGPKVNSVAKAHDIVHQFVIGDFLTLGSRCMAPRY